MTKKYKDSRKEGKAKIQKSSEKLQHNTPTAPSIFKTFLRKLDRENSIPSFAKEAHVTQASIIRL